MAGGVKTTRIYNTYTSRSDLSAFMSRGSLEKNKSVNTMNKIKQQKSCNRYVVKCVVKMFCFERG